VPPGKKTSKDTTKPVAKRKTAAKKAPVKKSVEKPLPEPVVAKTRRKPAASSYASATHDLVIVESPAKAKTINKYLGDSYKVMASYGHVRDLPKRKIKGERIAGVNIDQGWETRYEVPKDKGERSGRGFRTPHQILTELKQEANRSRRVLLATDPDREGEAIAWHLLDELNLDDDRTFRIAFNEITRNAVNAAIAHPGKIDMNRVGAQEARRILDRVVGFPLSNLLGKKVTRGLSAGRVQSVAVRMIVEREREIDAFIPEEYWKIIAVLSKPAVGIVATPYQVVLAKSKKVEAPVEGEADAEEKPQKAELPAGAFAAELAEWKGEKFAATSEAVVRDIAQSLDRAAYSIRGIEQKDTRRNPSAPFTTSTMQQTASQRLHFSASRTMQTAQKLYEGVPLGSEGQVALITYMRTDSTRVSPDALTAVRQHIQGTYGDRYLPEKPNAYASGKSAQEAHEAVRPTDLNFTPQRVASLGLIGDQLKLYTLIFNRFVASQMAPAIVAETNVEILADDHGAKGILKAKGSILKFDGYRRVMPAGKQEDVLLPALTPNEPLQRHGLTASQHFTEPPPRFNEASLVKGLEKEGIGRPSTYASIISTIQKRGYVEQKERRFYATEMGKLVTDLLVQHFPKIMNVKFTSHFEEELDEIETGKLQKASVLNEFWEPFEQALSAAEVDMPAMKGKEIGEACPKCTRPLVEMYSQKTGSKFIGCSGWRDKENQCTYKRTMDGKEILGPVETEHKCPTCGKPMIQKEGRFGAYLVCAGAPECKTTMNFDAEGKLVVSAQTTTHKCEKCGKPMVLREWRGKKFLGCSGYPGCRNSMDVDAEGNPIKPADIGISCEKCGSPMRIRKSFRGPFLSCSAYPKCRNAKSINAELREKLKDLLPPPTPKKEGPQIEVTETCPQCGSAMKVRQSGRGAFLGCTKYPKCRGTMPVSEAILEKLADAGAF